MAESVDAETGMQTDLRTDGERCAQVGVTPDGEFSPPTDDHQQQWSAFLKYHFDKDIVRLRSTGRTLCDKLAAASIEKGGASLNFCKALEWSPDGTCVLTSTNDNKFRLYDNPPYAGWDAAPALDDDPLVPGLVISEPEAVYDTAWYPHMTSAGLISSITFNPDFSGMYAAGSFFGSIGLYDERNDELLHQIILEKGRGLTQVSFSRDGTQLFYTSRKSNTIICRDLRNSGDVLATFARSGNTNQRIGFSLDPQGRYLSTGDETGRILVYNLHTKELVKEFQAHNDTVSSASFHPTLPLLASCSGQRRDVLLDRVVYDADGRVAYIEGGDASDSEDGLDPGVNGARTPVDSSVTMWQIPHEWISSITDARNTDDGEAIDPT
ncbi:hypothetical protein HDU86_003078 [Geranomyces michiganensis]|nr:hypothetical protein HDU86_003078 [Geranomyces michiganensis]